MGILKNIAKFAGGVFDTMALTPVPEYIGIINAVVDLGVLVQAYYAKPEIETHDDSYSATIIEEKTNPGEIWLSLIPGEDFSVRNAVKKYRELDDEGKVIFAWSAVSFGLHSLTAILTVRRSLIYLKNYTELEAEFDKNMALTEWIRSKCNTIGSGADRVVKWYEEDTTRLNAGGDTLHNYNNMKFLREDMMDIIAKIGGAAA